MSKKILFIGLFVLLSITIIFFVVRYTENNSESSYSVKVHSLIKEYNPYQSKYMGLPLVISIIDEKGDKVFKDIDYIIYSDYGSLFTTESTSRESYKVTDHGDMYEVSKTGTLQVHWGCISSGGSVVPEDIKEIAIKIDVYNNNVIVATKHIKILQNQVDRFRLDEQ